MPFAIKPKQTVLFIGDSITDCGRRGAAAPMGDGYPAMIAELVDARYPSLQTKWINTGIGGNTIRDLTNRFYDDCIRHKPDWVSVKIGINDLHRWMANAGENVSVSPEQYADMYEGLMQRLKKETGAKIILMDPFYISTESHAGMHRTNVLKELPKYIKTVHAMVKKHRTKHVKTHDLFHAALKHHSPDRWCPEPVHPYRSGHLLMAQDWLKQMGY